MNERIIRELEETFPYTPIHAAPRIQNVEDWILQRGIEAGREEVIIYLRAKWGVDESRFIPEDVYSPQNRIPADLYGTASPAPYPEPGTDPG